MQRRTRSANINSKGKNANKAAVARMKSKIRFIVIRNPAGASILSRADQLPHDQSDGRARAVLR